MRGLKCASLNNSHINSHRNHTNRIFYNDIFITIDRSIELFGVFGDYYASGQDARVTKSLDVTENDDVNP